MRVPQVNERVKEAPAQALRAMFAGIGQLLLFTDKLRNRTETDEKKEPEEIGTGTTTTATATATAEKAPATTVPEQPVPEAKAEATTHTAPAAATVSAPATSGTEAASARKATKPLEKVTEEPGQAPAAAPKAAAPKASAASTSELPLANYDDLTVASLRARLRNLTADQLTVLIGYEKTHANREDIIAMFERRILKLAEG